MILNKNYLWKIFFEDEFEKINYVGRHSAARLGRGFQYPIHCDDYKSLKHRYICTYIN